MRRRALWILCHLGVLAMAAPSLGWSQQGSTCPAPTNGPSPILHVRGAVDSPLDLNADDLAGLPRRRLQVEERDGGVAEYEGILLADVLARAGVPMESLRGRQAATVVVAEARDGYRAVYALAELDPAFSDRELVLADRKNGAELSADEGPFRLIMLGERRHSRWIRQLSCLRVTQP